MQATRPKGRAGQPQSSSVRITDFGIPGFQNPAFRPAFSGFFLKSLELQADSDKKLVWACASPPTGFASMAEKAGIAA
jgi:hypothetical protein